MGLGLGIVGGAMQGVGVGGNQFAGFMEKSQLQQEAAQIQQMRDERLSELRKGEMSYEQDLKRKPYIEAAGAVDKFKATPAYDDATDSARPRSPAEVRDYEKGEYKKRGLIETAMTMDEHDRTRDLSRDLAHMTDERIREEGQLNREQQLTLHRERMAEIKGQAKNAGLSVQQTEQGLAIVNASTKEVTLLKDPTDGKPLKGAKQEDSLAVIKSIGELAKSMETTNPEMAKKLGDIAIGVLSGKLGKDVGPQPTDDDIKGLRDRAANPQAVAFFESKYGKGAAAKFLPKAAAPAPRPAAPAAAAAASSSGAQERSVTVAGMGSIKKSEIPARIADFQSVFQRAQKENDTAEMVRVGNIIQSLHEAEKSPGI